MPGVGKRQRVELVGGVIRGCNFFRWRGSWGNKRRLTGGGFLVEQLDEIIECGLT